MTAGGARERPSKTGEWVLRVLSRAWQALWLVAVPGVLAILAAHYLVPTVGSGFAGVVADVAHHHGLLFGLSLYLAFSALAHHWRRSLPGARLAWPEALEPRDTGRGAARWAREALALSTMVGAAVVCSLAARAWIARPYRVLSASMLPTLEPEDLVAGRMRTYGPDALPRRGDVVVFRSAAVPGGPSGRTAPDVLVKRVIGLPGDVITMRGPTPVINGWPIPVCDVAEYIYVNPEPGDPGLHGRLRVEFLENRAYLAVYAIGSPDFGKYVVQPGEVFVLGDNRGNSSDSRAFHDGRGGGVPLEGIEARVDWFLAGTHRNGDVDMGRFLKPIDGLQLAIRFEGVQRGPLEDGVAQCLRDCPTRTMPPLP